MSWVMGQVMGLYVGWVMRREKLGEQGHNMWTSQYGAREAGYLMIITNAFANTSSFSGMINATSKPQ